MNVHVYIGHVLASSVQKKMEEEMNTKNNLKILVIVIVRKGLKEINFGNEKRQQCMKKVNSERGGGRLKTEEGKNSEGLAEDH